MEFGIKRSGTKQGVRCINTAELVVGIAVPGAGNYTRKETDALIEWVNVHK
jgi:aspartyl-tRNA synthetase